MALNSLQAFALRSVDVSQQLVETVNTISTHDVSMAVS